MVCSCDASEGALDVGLKVLRSGTGIGLVRCGVDAGVMGSLIQYLDGSWLVLYR